MKKTKEQTFYMFDVFHLASYSTCNIKTYICFIFVKPTLKFYLSTYYLKMFHFEPTPNSKNYSNIETIIIIFLSFNLTAHIIKYFYFYKLFFQINFLSRNIVTVKSCIPILIHEKVIRTQIFIAFPIQSQIV